MIKLENYWEIFIEYWNGILLRWSSGYLSCFLLGKEDKVYFFFLLNV